MSKCDACDATPATTRTAHRLWRRQKEVWGSGEAGVSGLVLCARCARGQSHPVIASQLDRIAANIGRIRELEGLA